MGYDALMGPVYAWKNETGWDSPYSEELSHPVVLYVFLFTFAVAAICTFAHWLLFAPVSKEIAAIKGPTPPTSPKSPAEMITESLAYVGTLPEDDCPICRDAFSRPVKLPLQAHVL